MTALHFVGGEKGGEGRSFVCRALIDYHRFQHIPFSVFDTCRSYSDVSRFYKGIEGCKAKEYSHDHSLPQIAFDVFDEELDGSVIVNLHTHGMKQMIWPQIEEDTDYYSAELQSKNAVVWFVSIGSCDSYRLLKESLDYFQGRVRHILVKNRLLTSYWGLENVDDKFDRMSHEYGFSVIDFPQFPPGRALRLIEKEDMPYIEAQQHPALSRQSRNQSSTFLKRASAAFESVKAVSSDHAHTHQLEVIAPRTVQKIAVA